MSCPAGNPSSRTFAVKSDSASASTWTTLRMVLKLSVVATSTSMRDGRSARAHTTAESTDTSPDWIPCVTTGRSATRLIDGLAMPPPTVSNAVEAAVRKKRRRVSRRAAAPPRMVTAMGPPPSNCCGGRCGLFLTATQRFRDGSVNHKRTRHRATLRDAELQSLLRVYLALAVFGASGAANGLVAAFRIVP